MKLRNSTILFFVCITLTFEQPRAESSLKSSANLSNNAQDTLLTPSTIASAMIQPTTPKIHTQHPISPLKPGKYSYFVATCNTSTGPHVLSYNVDGSPTLRPFNPEKVTEDEVFTFEPASNYEEEYPVDDVKPFVIVGNVRSYIRTKNLPWRTWTCEPGSNGTVKFKEGHRLKVSNETSLITIDQKADGAIISFIGYTSFNWLDFFSRPVKAVQYFCCVDKDGKFYTSPNSNEGTKWKLYLVASEPIFDEDSALATLTGGLITFALAGSGFLLVAAEAAGTAVAKETVFRLVELGAVSIAGATEAAGYDLVPLKI